MNERDIPLFAFIYKRFISVISAVNKMKCMNNNTPFSQPNKPQTNINFFRIDLYLIIYFALAEHFDHSYLGFLWKVFNPWYFTANIHHGLIQCVMAYSIKQMHSKKVIKEIVTGLIQEFQE